MLVQSDRCDRCGAQAFAIAIFASSDLLFCAHHFREFKPMLELQGAELYDFSDQINERPSTSASIT